MNRQDVLKIYKQHLDIHFAEDESRAILQWVKDYIEGCSDSEFKDLLTVEDRSENLPPLRIFQALERLLNLEPVQYVFQTAFFHKYQFKVDSNTLIPRPETEELIELILQENPKFSELNIRGLDIGTGSGCIPITLLKERLNWKFDAIDISPDALNIAKFNAATLQVDNRIEFENLNILESDINFSSYNLIVSNPPYIPFSESTKLDQRVTKFEPHIALFTESDPLVFYKRIANLALKTAQKGTQIWLETHQDYCNQTVQLFESLGIAKKIEDLSGNPRFIYCLIS